MEVKCPKCKGDSFRRGVQIYLCPRCNGSGKVEAPIVGKLYYVWYDFLGTPEFMPMYLVKEFLDKSGLYWVHAYPAGGSYRLKLGKESNWGELEEKGDGYYE